MLLGSVDVNLCKLSEDKYSYSLPIINSHFSAKDIQLGRRNLTPIQKISIAEKYRPIYEKQAKENQILAGGDRKSDEYKKSVTPNSGDAIKRSSSNETNTRLSKLAGVGKETYRMGAKILNSDNEKLKQEVLSGKKSINAETKSSAKKAPTLNNNIAHMWVYP